MTDSLARLLEGDGYRVQTANSGAEGIEALKNRNFPVVVTDLRMQGVDGLEVVRYVDENHPRTLVIVVTGYASTESAIEALHHHAFDYLRKPFEFDAFKAAIERAFHKLEVDLLREDTAAMLTHDLKVPLTSILGYASMFYDRETGKYHDRAPDFAEIIRTNAQKMLALVDNYLATCRVDADNFLICPRMAPFKPLIDDIVEVIQHEAERSGFQIELPGEIDPPEVVFDESQVYRALSNLLQNAVKYGDPAEPVRIIIERLEGEASSIGKPAIKLEVVNLAPDVRPESLQGLFGRFKRAQPNSGIEGSGIGLYVVDAVARAHGGHAGAECLDGGRVSFSIVFPLDLDPIETSSD